MKLATGDRNWQLIEPYPLTIKEASYARLPETYAIVFNSCY